MAPMRPLPVVPTSPILDLAEPPPGHDRRLELWNLDGLAVRPTLDYVVLSTVREARGAPTTMVTTRLRRTPDPDLDPAVGTERLVPAARLSILTIPLPGAPADRLATSDSLLAALAADERPWAPAACTVDGSTAEWRVLRWDGGALWVGQHDDVTVSVITPESEDLCLRSLDEAETRELTATAP
jgi:hypothetical protein